MDTISNTILDIDMTGDQNNREITLTERINVDKLAYLIENHEEYNLGAYYEGKELDDKASLNLFKSYLRKVQQSDTSMGSVNQVYKQKVYGKDKKSVCFGRYQGSDGLTLAYMKREVRHTISRDFYYDIDMKNAHPSILAWYCTQNNIACDALKDYSENTDIYRQEMMENYGITKDKIKADMLAILNGGKRNYQDPPEWFSDYISEMKEIHKQVVKLNPTLLEYAKESKARKNTEYNITGTCVNYLMLNYENRFLMAMYDWLKIQQGVSVEVLVYDGLMLSKDNINKKQLQILLKGCEKVLADKFGINIEICEKKMEEHYELPEDIPRAVIDMGISSEIKDLLLEGTDLSLAKIVSILFDGKIKLINDEIGWFFDDSKKLWVKVVDYELFTYTYTVLNKTILSLSEECTDKNMKIRIDKIHKLLGSASFPKKLMNRLSSYCLEKDFGKLLNKNPILLPIQGQLVLDLTTGIVKDRLQTDYFSFECPVSIIENGLEWAEKFFLDLANGDQDLAVYLKTLMLYFCSGMTFHRSFYQLIGSGRNGKSSFINILEELLKDLCLKGSNRTIIQDKYNKSDSGPRPDIVAMESKRVITYTETSTGDILNAASIKMLTGDDTISARNLYANNYSYFKMMGKILIGTNNPIEFHDNDKAVKDRAKYIPFNNTFEANDKFMKDVLENRLSQIFTVCLIAGKDSLLNGNITNPKCVIDTTEDMFADMDIIQNFLDETFDKDNNSKVASAKIYESYNIYCSAHRITPIGKVTLFKRLVEKGINKEKIKTGYVFSGLKYKERNIESIDLF